MKSVELMRCFLTILWWLAISASCFGVVPPAKLLDLSHWKLTLPVDIDRSGSPDEIEQPELNSFYDARYFFINGAGTGVVFRAHVGGSATKNSKYPRCELREMRDDGKTPAAWGTKDGGIHTMSMVVAITRTPPVKRHVACAQIHGGDDDVMQVRLEGTKLSIERNSLSNVMLDRAYKLGTPFKLTIQAGDGGIKVWYNGDLKMNWNISKKECYFKAGCYTLSNPIKGDAEDSFGEVIIYRLQIEHRNQP